MKRSSTLRALLAFAATLLLAANAHALLFRAYLASDGNDANPCTLPQPCRLLPAALSAVADGGEIWMLDSANYNTTSVTIGKSVSILAIPGAVGSVVAAGGPAIDIAASGLTVALRNLVIVPLPGGIGTNGVLMTGASSLTIEHSLIANLGTDGVLVLAGTVKIADSIIRNNAGVAVNLQQGAAGTISRTQMLGNTLGGVVASSFAATTTTASVSDSVVSGGTDSGVAAYSGVPGAIVKVFVTRSTIEGTAAALHSETVGGVGSTLVTVSYSLATNNDYGWYQNGAGSVIKSLGNNHITDNTTTFGSLTPIALQ